MAASSRTVGIDLGTTNSCVATVRNKLPRLLPLDQGRSLLPSVVGVAENGSFVVGHAAKRLWVHRPRSIVYGAKRFIGTQFHSPAVDALKSHFAYELVEGAEGQTAVQLEGRVFSLVDLLELLFLHIRESVEKTLEGALDGAVIAVPAYFHELQRAAVKEAAKKAGIPVLRLVNEPTAAALAYGFSRDVEQKILVYDMGGGTFDVSVLQLTGSIYEVLATGGDPLLGGADFDQRLVDYVLEAFRKETRVDLSKNAVALQRIREAAETAKVDLTMIPNVTIELPFIETFKGKPLDLRVNMTREKLNALTSDLVERSLALCDRVLEEKGFLRTGLDEVLLVGGQSRMPLIQQRVLTHFGKAPRKGVHPDECVALGAALLADSLNHLDSVTLLDVLSMPIGLADAGGRFRTILEKDSPVPSSRSIQVPMPHVVGSNVIDLDIFQGLSEWVAQNEYLGTVTLPSSAAGRKLNFRLTEESLIQVCLQTDSGLEELPVKHQQNRPKLPTKVRAQEPSLGAKPERQIPESVWERLKRAWKSQD